MRTFSLRPFAMTYLNCRKLLNLMKWILINTYAKINSFPFKNSRFSSFVLSNTPLHLPQAKEEKCDHKGTNREALGKHVPRHQLCVCLLHCWLTQVV